MLTHMLDDRIPFATEINRWLSRVAEFFRELRVSSWILKIYALVYGGCVVFLVFISDLFDHQVLGKGQRQEIFLALFGTVLASVALTLSYLGNPEERSKGALRLALLHLFLLAAMVNSGMSTEVFFPFRPGDLIFWAAILGYVWLYPQGHLGRWRFRSSRRDESTDEDNVASIRSAAQAGERKRLARELHDSVKQQLFVIKTAAATAQLQLDKDGSGAARAVADVQRAAREALTEMQALLDNLQATRFEDVGLVEALRAQCEALEFRTGARVTFQSEILPSDKSIAPGAQEVIFRIALEALSNVARHARASSVLVFLRANSGKLSLAVQDDGSGFVPESATSGMGQATMKRRAQDAGGVLRIESSPGGGRRSWHPCLTPLRRAKTLHGIQFRPALH